MRSIQFTTWVPLSRGEVAELAVIFHGEPLRGYDEFCMAQQNIEIACLFLFI